VCHLYRSGGDGEYDLRDHVPFSWPGETISSLGLVNSLKDPGIQRVEARGRVRKPWNRERMGVSTRIVEENLTYACADSYLSLSLSLSKASASVITTTVEICSY
jgi:hypothetical protein